MSTPSGISIAPGVFVPEGAVAFSFSRSSGPGGQNVNKVSTRVELRIALRAIPIGAEARGRLAGLAGSRVTSDGELLITADEHRSQSRNKAEALERLRDLIVRALVRPKKRRPTRPGRGAVERRLEGKRVRAERKRMRRTGEE
jgi:ribosome-associated protein